MLSRFYTFLFIFEKIGKRYAGAPWRVSVPYAQSWIYNYSYFRRKFTTYSVIHKDAVSLVTGRSLQNGQNVRCMWMGERSPETVLYGDRQSGGFVNRAVIGLLILSGRGRLVGSVQGWVRLREVSRRGVCPVGLREGVCVYVQGVFTFPLWTEFLTHACGNITFPQPLLRTVNMFSTRPILSSISCILFCTCSLHRGQNIPNRKTMATGGAR